MDKETPKAKKTDLFYTKPEYPGITFVNFDANWEEDAARMKEIKRQQRREMRRNS